MCVPTILPENIELHNYTTQCLGFLARSVSSKPASLVNHPAAHFLSQKTGGRLNHMACTWYNNCTNRKMCDRILMMITIIIRCISLIHSPCWTGYCSTPTYNFSQSSSSSSSSSIITPTIRSRAWAADFRVDRGRMGSELSATVYYEILQL